MSNFTVKSPHFTSVVSLKESLAKGHVDIMVSAPDGRSYRIASIGDGKLKVVHFNSVIAEQIGLILESDNYPTIDWVG